MITVVKREREIVKKRMMAEKPNTRPLQPGKGSEIVEVDQEAEHTAPQSMKSHKQDGEEADVNSKEYKLLQLSPTRLDNGVVGEEHQGPPETEKRAIGSKENFIREV